MMAEYRLKWTDSGNSYKRIYINQKNTSAAGNTSALRISVIDQDGAAVSLTGITTSTKIYVGIEGTLKLNGGAMSVVSDTSGTLIYRLTGTDISEAGVYAVNVYCADNAAPASATDALTAGNLVLEVVDSLTD